MCNESELRIVCLKKLVGHAIRTCFELKTYNDSLQFHDICKNTLVRNTYKLHQ